MKNVVMFHLPTLDRPAITAFIFAMSACLNTLNPSWTYSSTRHDLLCKRV